MKYVNLGRTGLRVSRVCLGMMSFGPHEERPWALPESDAEPIVRRAIEGGITFFDTADVYNGGESEVITGRVLSRLLPREEYVLATKVHGRTWPGENGRGLNRKHILASIDFSLQRLGLDYVDLYQTHRWDHETPIEETMEALHDIVRAGQGALHRREQHVRVAVREGAGGCRAQRLDAVRLDAEPLQPDLPRGGAGDDPAVHRPGRRRPPVEPARARDPGRQPRRAAASASRRRAQTDSFGDSLYDLEQDLPVVERTFSIADARGIPSAQLALAWVLSKPGVTAPIVGATKVQHVEDALAAEQLELFEDEIASLEEPYVPHRVVRAPVARCRRGAREPFQAESRDDERHASLASVRRDGRGRRARVRHHARRGRPRLGRRRERVPRRDGRALVRERRARAGRARRRRRRADAQARRAPHLRRLRQRARARARRAGRGARADRRRGRLLRQRRLGRRRHRRQDRAPLLEPARPARAAGHRLAALRLPRRQRVRHLARRDRRPTARGSGTSSRTCSSSPTTTRPSSPRRSTSSGRARRPSSASR